MSKYGPGVGVVSTGFRAPLLFNQAGLAALSTGNQVTSKPQCDFRGENLVIDPTTVGPSSAIAMPTVGSLVQIIGGGNSTTVPGTLFDPRQCGALDFEMDIAEQGNDIVIIVTNTSTNVTLTFACALFGHKVAPDQGGQAATAGVLPPHLYRSR
jgi:hypothetical protein